jgi:hypothetical protein
LPSGIVPGDELIALWAAWRITFTVTLAVFLMVAADRRFNFTADAIESAVAVRLEGGIVDEFPLPAPIALSPASG